MANCETNGHVYRQFSTKCVMCGEEGTNFAKCSPPCKYYDSGTCRCAQMEGPVPGYASDANAMPPKVLESPQTKGEVRMCKYDDGACYADDPCTFCPVYPAQTKGEGK